MLFVLSCTFSSIHSKETVSSAKFSPSTSRSILMLTQTPMNRTAATTQQRCQVDYESAYFVVTILCIF